MEIIKVKTAAEAVQVFADDAQAHGADANDTTGYVRALVTSYGFGFEAWFCVCIELGDRAAKAAGFENQMAMAFAGMKKN